MLTFYRRLDHGFAKKRGGAKRATATASRRRVLRRVVIRPAELGSGLGSEGEQAGAQPRPGQARAARRRTSGRPAARGRIKIKTLARFRPFALDRGHVVMKLRVPGVLRPTHIGISVREVKPRLKAAGRKGKRKQQLAYEGIGPKGGSIVFVQDYELLHKRKSGGSRPKVKGRRRR